MGQLWSSRWGSSCIKTLGDNDCCFDSIKNNKSLLPWKGKHPRWHSWIYECGWKWWSMVFELRNFTCNFFLTLEQSAAFQIISCKRLIRVTITLSFHNKKKIAVRNLVLCNKASGCFGSEWQKATTIVLEGMIRENGS